jgi:uncharacterized protein (TIGR04255 family)
MNAKLPKAPLTEVVFEMHWGIIESPTAFPVDPGYPQALDALSAYAAKHGFNKIRDFHQAYTGIGRSIARRFLTDSSEFPLLQIGHGVFAANESVDYEWTTFKEMATNGAGAICASYPHLKDFGLDIIHLEIRYLDSFEKSFLESSDIFHFLNADTKFKFDLPPFWESKLVGSQRRGRILVETEVRKIPGSVFTIDFASAQQKDVPVVRMETKVTSNGSKLLPTKKIDSFYQKLDDWLEKAHEATSISFREIIKSETYEKFK